MTWPEEWQFIEEMINVGKSMLFLRKQVSMNPCSCILDKKLYVRLFYKRDHYQSNWFSFPKFCQKLSPFFIHPLTQRRKRKLKWDQRNKITSWFTTHSFWSDLQIQLKCLINTEHLKMMSVIECFHLKVVLKLTFCLKKEKFLKHLFLFIIYFSKLNLSPKTLHQI